MLKLTCVLDLLVQEGNPIVKERGKSPSAGIK